MRLRRRRRLQRQRLVPQRAARGPAARAGRRVTLPWNLGLSSSGSRLQGHGTGLSVSWGPRGLQNQLLAYHLGRETQIRCLVADGLDSVWKAQEENENSGAERGGGAAGRPLRIVLMDCMGLEQRAVLSKLRGAAEVVQGNNGNWLLALFNVRDHELVEEAVGLGVRGFFYENDCLEHFERGIRALLEGHLWLSREMMTQYFMRNHRERAERAERAERREGRDGRWARRQRGFEDAAGVGGAALPTRREAEILKSLANGDSNDALADRLCISPHTVKTHLYNIFRKINVTNRFQAARWAERNLGNVSEGKIEPTALHLA